MATTINSNTTDGIVITPDTSGEIELQADGVTKAKVTANGLQDANGASLRGGSFRNLVINGDMQIAQRGTSATGKTTGGYFTVDRFAFYPNQLGTWTNTQSTDTPTEQGFSNSYKLECTTADASPASGDVLTLQQKIEAQNCQHLKYGTSSAETLTLSFWVKSNKTGTYNFNLRKDDDNRRIVKQYTINSANTWEKKTVTIEGDTSGAINNDNGIGLQLVFWLGAGSNYTTGSVPSGWSTASTTDYAPSQVNLADSTSNYINITGVQLEVGEGASDFEFLPYDVQLARCQRYYEVMASGYLMLAVARTSDYIRRVGYQYKVTKRANPTITITSQTADGASTISAYSPTTDNVDFNTSGGASAIPRVNAFTMDSEL